MTVQMPRRGVDRRTQLQRSSQPRAATSSDINVRLERPAEDRRSSAFTALGRAAEKGRRQSVREDLGGRRSRDGGASRRSAFVPSRPDWPLDSFASPLDVAGFEEILLIRDKRRMHQQGSTYLLQLAREHPDQLRRVVSAARRVFAAFKRPIPLSDRALYIVLRSALPADLRIAIVAIRALVQQYPSSPHTPPAMFAAASIQRHLGHNDNSSRTLWRLAETYPDSLAGTKALALLAGQPQAQEGG